MWDLYLNLYIITLDWRGSEALCCAWCWTMQASSAVLRPCRDAAAYTLIKASGAIVWGASDNLQVALVHKYPPTAYRALPWTEVCPHRWESCRHRG